MKEQSAFESAQAFHLKMDGSLPGHPTELSPDQSLFRMVFKLEEMVEYLHASFDSEEDFQAGLEELRASLHLAEQKVMKKGPAKRDWVGQIDALVDLLYFTYGTFALMGLDPAPFFQIVHEANMGKFFPDGKVHYDPKTHKILKPANWEKDFAPEGRLKMALEAQRQTSKKD